MQQLHSIQFLRFVAALLVVFHHAYELIDKELESQFTPWLFELARFGNVGVHIFFVISGFVMVYTTHKKERSWSQTKTFLTNRFLRIYPIYWACCLMMAIYYWVTSESGPQNTLATINTLLLLPEYASGIIKVGWTLSFEVYFYALFALIIPFHRHISLAALCIALFCLVVAGKIFSVNNPNIAFLTNVVLLDFIAGMVVAYLIIHQSSKLQPLASALVVLSLIGFGITLYIGKDGLSQTLLFGLPSTLLILGLAVQETKGCTPHLIRQYAWLGDSSYSLYLTHIMIINIAIHLLNTINITPGDFSVVIISGLCIAFGACTYRLIEKPLTRLKVGSKAQNKNT